MFIVFLDAGEKSLPRSAESLLAGLPWYSQNLAGGTTNEFRPYIGVRVEYMLLIGDLPFDLLRIGEYLSYDFDDLLPPTDDDLGDLLELAILFSNGFFKLPFFEGWIVLS